MVAVAYSFSDVTCTISGPGGTIVLSDANSADEGISVAMTEDQSTMTGGAGIGVMHSLHASRRGRVVVRLLKNSPVNAMLMAMQKRQFGNAALHGQNVISVRMPYWLEDYACTQVAFVRYPDNGYSKDGNTLEWLFDAGYIDPTLGDGSLLSVQ